MSTDGKQAERKTAGGTFWEQRVNTKQTKCPQQVDQWRLVFIQFAGVVAAFETSLHGLWGNQVGQNEIYLNKTDFLYFIFLRQWPHADRLWPR